MIELLALSRYIANSIIYFTSMIYSAYPQFFLIMLIIPLLIYHDNLLNRQHTLYQYKISNTQHYTHSTKQSKG